MSERVESDKSDALAVSPALNLMLDSAQVPRPYALVDGRVLLMCGISVVIGLCMAVIAALLIQLIFLFTNIAFYGQFSTASVSPWGHRLGAFVLVPPVIGGVLVGLMARYGSKAIRGHGIPEAMEQVLTNDSRIPARVLLLKPLSAAISIGTGGPFGAEGPIIATGGALGSLVGQVIRTSAIERKTLLAAGAAAGMAATFGSPVSAVLLAVELLLFEYRARSVVPVALASTAAAGLRILFEGHEAIFPLPNVKDPTLFGLAFYILLGALIGVLAVAITKLIYAMEDAFEHLPIHWMWWPAVGGLAVGGIGYFFPRTLGVGYENISDALSGQLLLRAAAVLAAAKFCSWCISLGSGTSGGTLAPLLTIGGCVGGVIGDVINMITNLKIDVRVAALVGMAAMFAGASRALLASVVFAFETTLQPVGLLPLLGGCSASYLISCYLMRHSIMTERMARRGVRASGEYQADLLDQIAVRSAASTHVVCLPANQTIAHTREWLNTGGNGATHQGFPVLDEHGSLVGVVTRRNLTAADVEPSKTVRDVLKSPPKFIYDDCTLREATEHMVNHDIGRLPVVSRVDRTRVVGIITRSDILSAYRQSLEERELERPTIEISFPSRRRKRSNAE